MGNKHSRHDPWLGVHVIFCCDSYAAATLTTQLDLTLSKIMDSQGAGRMLMMYGKIGPVLVLTARGASYSGLDFLRRYFALNKCRPIHVLIATGDGGIRPDAEVIPRVRNGVEGCYFDDIQYAADAVTPALQNWIDRCVQWQTKNAAVTAAV